MYGISLFATNMASWKIGIGQISWLLGAASAIKYGCMKKVCSTFGSRVFALQLYPHLQGRPIKMRAPILYLANRWMNSKMLLTPNRF